MGTCALVKKDTTTQGNWVGVYGSQGWSVIGDTTSYPSYATVTPTGWSGPYSAGSSTDVRALQKASNNSVRSTALMYAASSATIDVSITDGNSHQVGIYFWDNDGTSVSFNLQVLDMDNGGNLLAQYSISGFYTTPLYLVFNFTGHVQLKFSGTGGTNPCRYNGLFFDPAGTPIAASGSVSFQKSDTATLGNWIGVYGADGYNVIGDTASYPSYATITPTGYALFNDGNTTSADALQRPLSPTQRIDQVWYGSDVHLDIQLTGGSHLIAIYFWDVGNGGRSQTVRISDPVTNSIYYSRTLTGFYAAPLYLQWSMSGHLALDIILNSGSNAVMSGIFFGAGSTTILSSQPFIFFLC